MANTHVPRLQVTDDVSHWGQLHWLQGFPFGSPATSRWYWGIDVTLIAAFGQHRHAKVYVVPFSVHVPLHSDKVVIGAQSAAT
jgi:hypothetical protein